MTFLAILANQAIALPLSPAFPNPELKYILNDSGAKLVLASEKLETKAQDVLKGDIENAPIYTQIHKILDAKNPDKVELEDMPDDVGGMMLYTSGTTNRPVRCGSTIWRNKTDAISRKESLFLRLLYEHNANPLRKHGSTARLTAFSTSSHSTTSTAA